MRLDLTDFEKDVFFQVFRKDFCSQIGGPLCQASDTCGAWRLVIRARPYLPVHIQTQTGVDWRTAASGAKARRSRAPILLVRSQS